MPMLTATISGKFLDPALVGNRGVTAYIKALTDGTRLQYGSTIISGRHKVDVQSNGNARVTLPLIPQSGLTPTGAKWRLVWKVLGYEDTFDFYLTGDTTWDALVDVSNVPVTASIQAAAEAARDAAASSASAAAASAAAAAAFGLGNSNGTDDTTAINTTLSGAAGKIVRGTPGQNYLISSALVLKSGTTLDMTGCTVTLKTPSTTQALKNFGTTATATGTGSMTSGSNVLTTTMTATVGQTVTVAGALSGAGGGPLTANVTATGAGTLTLSRPAQTTVSAVATAAYTRDTGITVKGGTWIRTDGSGTNVTGHLLYFRHVDGLVIRPDVLTATGGLRLVSVGDVTDFEIDTPQVNPWRVGVQINGPAARGRIGTIISNGAGTDDLFAITANDYSNMADVAGDVVDVSVGTIVANGNYDACKIIAGVGCNVDRISVDTILGTVSNAVALCGDDSSNAGTTGGTYGSIDYRWLGAVPLGSGPVLGLQSPNAKSIRARGAVSTVNAISVFGTSTATIGLLHLSFYATGITANAAQLTSSTVTITKLLLDGWHVDNGGNASGTNLFNQQAGTITEAVLRDCGGSFSNTTNGRGFYMTGGTATKIVVRGGTYDHTNSVVVTTSASKVILRGVDSTNSGRLVNLTGSTILDIGGGCSITGNASSPIFITTGPLTMTGEFLNYTGSSLLQRAATETVRSRSPMLPLNLSLLAQNVGDMAYNTAAASAPFVNGPVMSDGTNWIPIKGYAKSGTATLVGGTVTVADTNITGTSKIRLSTSVNGGTVGHPYVSARVAGTSFTITSTSGTDTSVIYYEVVTY